MLQASPSPPIVVHLHSVAGVCDCVHRVACVHVAVIVLIICLENCKDPNKILDVFFTCWFDVRLDVNVGLFSFVSFIEIVVFGSVSFIGDDDNLKLPRQSKISMTTCNLLR